MLSRRSFLKASTAAAASVTVNMRVSPVSAQSRAADEFVDYDALGMADLIKSGEISAREAVEVTIRRIEAMEPILNFMTTRTYERARDKANQFPSDSAFAGVPILIKDMVDVGGVRRTDGARLLATNVPVANVDYIDRVEEAGLNIVGLTNVPELANGFTCNNELFGATLNPWNLDYSPMVSSGGAACAAAAGILPLVHGTDGAGSNRLPASTCGLFGFKPSRFRNVSGEADGGHDRTKTNQAMSRTVRDSARLADITEDKSGTYYEPMGFVEGPSARRLRIAYVPDAPAGAIFPVDDEVIKAQAETAALLEEMGHTLVEAEYPVDTQAYTQLYPLFVASRVTPLKAMIESMTGGPLIESGLLTRFQSGFVDWASRVPAEESARAEAFIESMPPLFEQAFADVDMILAPVMPSAGALNSSFDPNGDFVESEMFAGLRHVMFTGPVNFAGNPAMSVPLTWDSAAGLPIGSHFIAPIGGDQMLYELAYELEEARPWRDRW
ncbi:MAG: twin-arginine translocation signal domain-containing protein, partial [Shimia sp.]|uniref:amidase n=1 Tax=Shimia sp. TaxID=1954381 RepID=UPI001B0212B4